MGFLGPLLNRMSDLSIRNGFLLYKQLIRSLTDYLCPAWRSAARTHVRRLQLCGLRVTVESYVAPKRSLQCKRCQCFGHTKRNC